MDEVSAKQMESPKSASKSSLDLATRRGWNDTEIPRALTDLCSEKIWDWRQAHTIDYCPSNHQLPSGYEYPNTFIVSSISTFLAYFMSSLFIPSNLCSLCPYRLIADSNPPDPE